MLCNFNPIVNRRQLTEENASIFVQMYSKFSVNLQVEPDNRFYHILSTF